ncbi:hypothetical protein, partial [uncultured Microbacterium sp.]|uniref:hypothetical protein n=1 Tax=uncultured Microbacterium sp. TaxID=191216 RepID=UPI0025F364CE
MKSPPEQPASGGHRSALALVHDTPAELDAAYAALAVSPPPERTVSRATAVSVRQVLDDRG